MIRLIKRFDFDERIRKELVFSDPSKIRLNSEDLAFPRIELKKDSSGGFPTDPNIFIETPLTTPHAIRKWLQFEITKIGNDQPPGTSIGLKLKTSTDQYFWNGTTWTVATLSDWSTEEEINDNFETFLEAVGDNSIGFVINLSTSDSEVTPTATGLKFLGNFDINFLDDIIYKSLIRKLNLEFRSTSEVMFFNNASSSSADLSTILENKGYNITGIESVYNVSDDQLKLSNLLSGYNFGNPRDDGFTFDPGVVNFSTPIPANKWVVINFHYIPEIMVNTAEDWFELATFPSIVLEKIEELDEPHLTSQVSNAQGGDLIRNIQSLTGVLQRPPEQKSLRIDYGVYTKLQIDQMRLSQDLTAFFAKDMKVTSYGLDRDYDLRVVRKLNTARNKQKSEAGGQKDKSDTNISSGTFDILGVLFFNRPSLDVPLVGANHVETTFTAE